MPSMSQFPDDHPLGPDHQDTPWDGDSFEAPAATATRVRPSIRPQTDEDEGLLKPWNVVLLDDDHHTYEYVMKMVASLFGVDLARAFAIAQTVDAQGRAVCLTTHKELAELKVEQIHGFGPDPLMSESAGSMSAILEPAEAGSGDDGSTDRPDGSDRAP